MQSNKIDQKVVRQEIAIDTYLSKLLDEIPSDRFLEQQLTEDVLIKASVERTQSKATKLENKRVAIKSPILSISKKTNKAVDSDQVVNSLSVMPEWTQNEFQALFFKVDKIVLAAPLTELLKTIKIERLPTNIPGQPSWFMGLLDVRERRIGVLDTGQLIFGKTRGQQRDLKQHPFKSILMTYDGNWGLACDEILSIGRLQPDKVRWRTLRNKRPWLVGTVIEELTAVIDVNQLVPRRKPR
jgi:purine-binding chemotaxis protein CheW